MSIDILQREDFVSRVLTVIDTLAKNKRSCCFAIDGEWGAGKSFVLDMIKNQLADIQSEETNDNRYFLFDYNCWQYDYYDEPSVAIISAMLDTIEEQIRVLSEDDKKDFLAAWGMVKVRLLDIVGKFTEDRIGVNVAELYRELGENRSQIEEEFAQKHEFDELFKFKKTIEEARTILTEIAQDQTIILVVDELDRCIPEYAIKVLERLHHLFDGIPNIIVMIAIDSKQLEHSIKQIYGEETSVENYLKKFISFSIKLDRGKVNANIFEKYATYFARFDLSDDKERDFVEEALPIVLENMEVRKQEKIFEKAELIHSILCTEIQDASLCVFEIMVLRYLTAGYSKNLYWIPEINTVHFGGLNKHISDENIEFLKELQKTVGNGRTMTAANGQKYYVIEKNIIDKVFWYLSKCYCMKNLYYLADEMVYEKELTIAKQFVQMLNIIE